MRVDGEMRESGLWRGGRRPGVARRGAVGRGAGRRGACWRGASWGGAFRRGFTLVELVIVLLIIAILFALLLPAIAGAMRKAKEARVLAEIDQMSAALELFKNKYHVYPPSRIRLKEDGAYDASLADPLEQLSIDWLRRIWPQINIHTDNTSVIAGGFSGFDWNGDGTATTGAGGTFDLDGAQCLVFFLGGIPAANPAGCMGFARDPVNPAPLATVLTSRDPSLFPFKGDRLVANPNGFLVYEEERYHNPTVPRPYAYFSAYGGKGYRPDDGDDVTLAEGAGDFTVLWPTPTTVTSYGPNPYTISVPVPASPALVRYWNPQGFQIVAPGPDGRYGPGGQFDPKGSPTINDDINSDGVPDGNLDNLTNFYTTTLGTTQ